MSRIVIIALALLLTGCATTPEPLPEPPPAPITVLCAVPAGLTALRREPLKPTGDFSQNDVAAYITALHEWGRAGWLTVREVRLWSDDCVDRETIRDSGSAD